MGNAAAAGPSPEELHVVCPAHAKHTVLEGLYRKVCADTQVVLEKEPDEPLGLTLLAPGNQLRAVKLGTPAERCGAARFLGRTVLSIGDVKLERGMPAAAAAGAGAGQTSVTITFDAEAQVHNGMPVWAKAPACRLYSTAEGKWGVTDSGKEGMGRSAGHVMTGLHGGQMPGEPDLQWMLYSKDVKGWVPNETTTVDEVGGADFRPGQLVEARLRDEAPPAFREATVRSAHPATWLEAGEPGQYTVTFAHEHAVTRLLPAACVRPHTAYRKDKSPAPAAGGEEATAAPAAATPVNTSCDDIIDALLMRPLRDVVSSYPQFKYNFDDVDDKRKAELETWWRNRDAHRLRPLLLGCLEQGNFSPLTPADKAAAERVAAAQ